jgi:RNA polymerase sigma factor (sigma-70 family)
MTKTDTRHDHLGRLMERAQAGDERAYLELLEEVATIVASVVRRQQWSLGPMDVEDIVQETLASVHTVRATYDPTRPFLPWLMSIANNRIIDRFRKSSRRSAHEISVAKTPETISAVPANHEEDRIAAEDDLRRAIAALPSSQRRAIELIKLRELSLKEAAEESGMTVSNLKVLVHRAIKTLRTKLVPFHE